MLSALTRYTPTLSPLTIPTILITPTTLNTLKTFPSSLTHNAQHALFHDASMPTLGGPAR